MNVVHVTHDGRPGATSQAQMEAMFASADRIGIAAPCGHSMPFERAWLGRDRFKCVECGLGWRVIQDAPRVHGSGWIEPGRRWVVIDGPNDDKTAGLTFDGEVAQ